jgi:hypothetical protein
MPGSAYSNAERRARLRKCHKINEPLLSRDRKGAVVTNFG